MAQSQGPSDQEIGAANEMVQSMKSQVDQSQIDQKALTFRLAQMTQMEAEYQAMVAQEKERVEKAAIKIARIEKEKDYFNLQVNEMLQKYHQLETSHNELINGQGQFEQQSIEDQQRLQEL